jgi:DNA mismatch endonuclease, patch repair protein
VYNYRSMDIVDQPTRSAMMASVRQANTIPELAVRRMLHSMGLRFRLNRRDLPGSPDIVLPRHKAVVFVHGCFWHRHQECKLATTPATNRQFWISKFEANVARDGRNVLVLQSMGWNVITVWQCETKDLDRLRVRLCSELSQHYYTNDLQTL